MLSRTRLIPLALCPALVVAACTGGDMDEMPDDTMAAPAPEMFTAALTSAQHPQPVMTDASGSAQFTVAADGSIQYTLTVASLSSTPTGAHIHGPAAPGETAGAIVRFTLADSSMTGQIATGTITATTVPEITLDSLKTLMRAGAVYVQVHTVNHGSGEIAGAVNSQ